MNNEINPSGFTISLRKGRQKNVGIFLYNKGSRWREFFNYKKTPNESVGSNYKLICAIMVHKTYDAWILVF